ncbi:MAG: hypothetical protein AAF329_00035 [Cyanobacteria bacterium P01_A01_bin.17]
MLPFVFIQGMMVFCKLWPVRVSLQTLWFLAITLLLFLIPGWVTKSFDAIFIQDEIPTLAFRTGIVVYLAGMACFPSVLGLAALMQQAIQLSPMSEPFLQRYFTIRRSLNSFILLIGGVIGLGSLTTGGLQNALQAHDASAAFPPEVTFVYGAYFSLSLSVFSLPIAWMLQLKGNVYLNHYLPMRTLDDNNWAETCALREQAREWLNLKRNPLTQIRANLGSLAPFLGGLLSYLLPGGG